MGHRDLVRLTVLFVLIAARPAAAQTFESVGIRAAGMAGAFVAVADDASAIYWNPAGLAAGALVSAVVERTGGEAGRAGFDAAGRAEAGRLGLQQQSGTLIAVGVPPLGVSYYRLVATSVDGGLPTGHASGRSTRLVTDNVAVNLLQSLADGVHVGASLRFVRGSAGAGTAGPGAEAGDLLDAAEGLARRSSSAFDVDAGVLVARGAWRAGLVARNLVAPSFGTRLEGERLAIPRQVRAGIAFLPRSGTTLSVDADLTRTPTGFGDARHLAAGVEHAIGARLTLRGGLRVNTVDAARPAGAAGASLALTPSAWLDAQVTRGGRDAARRWGVGLRMGF